MFCPKCHAEYREGFYKCADCDVWLVNALPDQGARKKPEPGVISMRDEESEILVDEPVEGEFDFQPLVTVLTTNNLSVLLMARGMLDSAGIDYYTQGDALGGVVDSRLLVREADAEEASKLLETLPDDGEMGELSEDALHDGDPPAERA